MARADIEIKGEIIAELEDIDDPRSGKSLLDALLVEQVEVLDGGVTITLMFDTTRSKEDRWALEESIYDALEELEGIEDLNILSMMTTSTDSSSPDVAAPATVEPATVGPETVGPETVEPDDANGGISVYSGGGCSAGTQSVIASDEAVSLTVPTAGADVKETPSPTVASVSAVDGAQAVTLSLSEYTMLIQSQRDNQHLKGQVRSLQDALRALLSVAG